MTEYVNIMLVRIVSVDIDTLLYFHILIKLVWTNLHIW